MAAVHNATMTFAVVLDPGPVPPVDFHQERQRRQTEAERQKIE
jgi:hypothetical protein